MKKLICLLILALTANCFALQKNVASQKWVVFAFDRTDNTAKTGDAANIKGDVRIDGGAENSIDDVNPTELARGYYVFDITAAESNGDYVLIDANSTTSNIQVVGCPMATWTTPPYFPAMSIDSNGRLDIIKIAGATQTANDNGADIDAILLDTAEIGAAGAGLTEAGGDGDHLTAINLPNQTMDIVGNITGNLSGSAGSLTGHTVQTGDSYAIVNGAAGLVAIDAKIDTAQADLNIITGAAGVVIATNTINADALNTDAVAEIWATAMSDLAAGAPSATATIKTAINYLYMAWRNGYKTDGTNSEIVLYKDDGTTPLVESTIADDGTDFTREEYRAPD